MRCRPLLGNARGGMKKNRIRCRWQPGRWHRQARRCQVEIGGRIEPIPQRRCCHHAATLDRMGAHSDADAVGVKDARDALIARALGSVAETNAPAASSEAGQPHDDGGFQQALGIEYDIVRLCAQTRTKAAHLGAGISAEQALAPAPQGKRNHAAHAAVQAHQIDVIFFDHPVDPRGRQMAQDVGHHRHVVQDVTE